MCVGINMLAVRGETNPIYSNNKGHEELIEELKLKDDKLFNRGIIRVEGLPLNKLSSTEKKDWEIKVDEEETIPHWWAEEKWEDKCWGKIKSIITEMNNTKKFIGSLDLQDTQIKELPEGLSVGGSLDLQDTQIKELPEGLSVGGSLYLRDTQIKELPEGLSVGGSLYLRDTQIKELPEGLSVGGSLYLRDTQITKIPKHLKDKVIL